MKLRLSLLVLLSALSVPAFATHTAAHHSAESSTPAAFTDPAKFYLGIFGGRGSSGNFNISQYGTAFITESSGGPLAVNAFGGMHSQTTSYFGAQLGYQMQEIMMGATQCALAPAAELEIQGMGSSSFSGHVINNTTRVPEHDFAVTYPMSRTVFLVNGVVNFSSPRIMVHPYIGFGVGNAVMRISGADSTQLSPPEAGVNHYNASTNSSDSAFAGQIKLGLSYDFNQYATVFAEYRWLYVASTQFEFGSTVYAAHAATSSWRVDMDAQRYNMGDVGIRFNL
ncbi:MAG TPA: hypothetical protein VL360_00400 [Gammaproteobacteria bacterium]|nr:hypothetical protein [Gammaproteobacteria bacterium]